MVSVVVGYGQVQVLASKLSKFNASKTSFLQSNVGNPVNLSTNYRLQNASSGKTSPIEMRNNFLKSPELLIKKCGKSFHFLSASP